MNSNSKGVKKRLEFSQRMAITITLFSISVTALTILLHFALIVMGYGGMSDVTIQTISSFSIVISAAGSACYSFLSLGRDWSKNKHLGITQFPDPSQIVVTPNIADSSWEESYIGGNRGEDE